MSERNGSTDQAVDKGSAGLTGVPDNARFEGDDQYDAFVGLLSMLSVASGNVANSEPDDHIRNLKGWILG